MDPRGSPDGDAGSALELARAAVERDGGFDAELQDIEAVAAHHANNYTPLVARQMRRDRATMCLFARMVQLEATSAARPEASIARSASRGRASGDYRLSVPPAAQRLPTCHPANHHGTGHRRQA